MHQKKAKTIQIFKLGPKEGMRLKKMKDIVKQGKSMSKGSEVSKMSVWGWVVVQTSEK